MRTETIEIYKFEELSPAAKQKALQKHREILWETGYTSAGDAHKSLESFCATFGIQLRESHYSTDAKVWVNYDEQKEEILALSGRRLIAYLQNNYYYTLFKRRPYGTYEKRNGQWCYPYYSKCQWVENDCPFTGYYMDEDLLLPIRKYLKAPNMKTTFKMLLVMCIAEWRTSAEEDCEHQESEEGLIEDIEANEREFYSDGTPY